jgi:hypothetical protein
VSIGGAKIIILDVLNFLASEKVQIEGQNLRDEINAYWCHFAMIMPRFPSFVTRHLSAVLLTMNH